MPTLRHRHHLPLSDVATATHPVSADARAGLRLGNHPAPHRRWIQPGRPQLRVVQVTPASISARVSAGILHSMATVVAFHAHPDDEVILTGGTLARAAAN